VNAIDQYVAPAPVRQDVQSASTQRTGSDAPAGETFGDVYNKAANNTQSNDADDAGAQQDGGQETVNADDKASSANGKHSTSSEQKTATIASVGSAIFKLAAEVKAKTDPNAEEPATGSATDEQASADTTKTVVDPKAAKAALEKLTEKAAADTTDTAAQTVPAEADAAAIALKLLGSDASASVHGKQAKVDETEGKEEPAKEETTDTKADAGAKATDAAATVAASTLVVHAAGDQSGSHQEQGKPKENEATSKALSAVVAAGSGTTGEDAAATGATTGDTVKTDTVNITVLDARRFVGSGESVSANTQAVMSGMTGDGDWAASMKAASSANALPTEARTATPVNTLKIQMTPESLGNVTATLRLHGDQLTVHLQVESGEAFKQMSQDKDGLIQSLKSQGYSVDQVSVQLAPAAQSSDRAVAQTSSGQQTGGQQMQDGSSAGQFAQQGRDQDNNRRQQDNGINANWQSDDTSVAVDPVAAASDTARSGQVYL
jgi:chemotaxis protein MotD